MKYAWEAQEADEMAEVVARTAREMAAATAAGDVVAFGHASREHAAALRRMEAPQPVSRRQWPTEDAELIELLDTLIHVARDSLAPMSPVGQIVKRLRALSRGPK